MIKETNEVLKLYLIGTFVLTYLFWGSIGIGNQFGYLEYGTPISMILFFIGGWMPTIMGIICMKKSGQISGVKDLMRDCFGFKQPIYIYAIVFLILFVYYFDLVILGSAVKINPFYAGVLSLPITIVFGGLEELGWRYFLQPALGKRFSLLVTACITGVLWSLWHLPLYFIAGYENIANFPAFAIDTFGFGFALAIVRHFSKNLWPCILLHAMLNAGSRVFDVKEGILDSIIQMIVLIILSIIIWWFLEKRKKKTINKNLK